MADEKSQLQYKISGDSKELVDGVNDGLRSVKQMTDAVKDGNNTIGATAQSANSKVQSVAKSASDAMASLSGYAFSIVGIIKALKDAAKYFFFQKQIDQLKDASEIAERNAENIRSISAANEDARRTTDGYMQRLGELAKKEKLSNAEKVEQKKLLKELGVGYSDLVKIMTDADGKLKNFDQAMAKKLQRDHDLLMGELDAQIAEVKRQMDSYREIAHFGNGFTDLITGGLAGKISVHYAEKLNTLTDQYNVLLRKRNDLRKKEPGKDYLEQAAAEKQDKAEAEKVEQEKKAQADALEDMKKLDDARQKYTEAEKKRSKALADEQVRQDKIALDSRLNSLKKRADAEKKRLGSFGFSLEVNPNESASSRRGRIRQMQMDQSIAEKQQIQREGGKVRYTAQEKRRIADYRESKGRLAKTEEQIAQLEAAGKAAEAARQQESAAARLNESATALNQAAIGLREAGGTVPAQPSPQPSTAKSDGVRNTKAAAQPVRRVNIATGISQTVSYGPILTQIANLLQTRAFIIRNS